MKNIFNMPRQFGGYANGLMAFLFLQSAWCQISTNAFIPSPGSPLAKRSHPRLHITQETIPVVKQAIATHYLAQYQRYVDWAYTHADDDVSLGHLSAWFMRPVMIHQAFIGALGEVPGVIYPVPPQTFGRRAINRLLFLLRTSDGEVGWVPALVYDWAYEYLTPSENFPAQWDPKLGIHVT